MLSKEFVNKLALVFACGLALLVHSPLADAAASLSASVS